MKQTEKLKNKQAAPRSFQLILVSIINLHCLMSLCSRIYCLKSSHVYDTHLHSRFYILHRLKLKIYDLSSIRKKVFERLKTWADQFLVGEISMLLRAPTDDKTIWKQEKTIFYDIGFSNLLHSSNTIKKIQLKGLVRLLNMFNC